MKLATALTLTFLAAVFGAVVSWVDLHATEVQVPALLLLIFGAALGAAWPKGSWLLGIIVGLGVPCAHAINGMLGNPPPFPSAPGSLVLPVAFGLVGAGIGALLRWGVGQASSSGVIQQ